MPTITCRNCGEVNPPEAVMCWACYTPIPGHEGDSVSEPSARDAALQSAVASVMVVAPPLLIGAGCLRSRGPLRVLFCSLGAVLAFFHIYRASSQLATDRRRANDEDGELSPIERIANAILLQAVKDEASAIRIQAFQRGCAVHYRIKGEWHEQMKVPKYIWKPLMDHLRLRAGLLDEISQRGVVNVAVNNVSRLMDYRYDTENETVTLEIV